MLDRLRSRATSLAVMAGWSFRFGPPRAWAMWREFRTLSREGFNPTYYQREVFDLQGLHPIVHFLDRGRAAGVLPVPPKPAPSSTPSLSASPRARARAFRPPTHSVALPQAAPHVSVIMACWNARETVGAAIRSVLNQTHAELRLIVVDDGSTDSSPDLIRANFASDLASGRLLLLEPGRAGVSAARNAGLAFVFKEGAAPSWVAYLDSDNVWAEDHLKIHLAALQTNGKSWSYGAMTGVRVDGSRIEMPARAYDRFALLQENWIDLNALVHHSDMIALVGGFDTRLRRLVDYDLALRLGRLGPPIVVSHATVDYRLSSDSISTREAFLPARQGVRRNHLAERISWGLEVREVTARDLPIVTSLADLPETPPPNISHYILTAPPPELPTAESLAGLARCLIV